MKMEDTFIGTNQSKILLFITTYDFIIEKFGEGNEGSIEDNFIEGGVGQYAVKRI